MTSKDLLCFFADSILTLDDENSTGPSSLESDLADPDNYDTLDSQDPDDRNDSEEVDRNDDDSHPANIDDEERNGNANDVLVK